MNTGAENNVSAAMAPAMVQAIMNAPHVRELCIEYAKRGHQSFGDALFHKEIFVQILVGYEEREELKGFFWVRTETIRVPKYEEISLSEALKRSLPTDAVVLTMAFDWHNQILRVFYVPSE